MAKKKTETPESGLENLNDSLTSMTSKVQDNKKVITYISVAVAAVVVIVLAYIYFFRTPGINNGNDAIGEADLQKALGNDSIALAQYQKVADEYGHDAGNRAALQSAIMLYQKGDYEQAIKYLKDYSAEEDIIGAGAYSLTGDCYVNLKKYDEAVNYFQKAIKQSDKNPFYTPFFMLKLARVYAEQGNHAGEADLYKQVMTDYPTYGQSNNIDVEKLYDRAKLQAEAK